MGPPLADTHILDWISEGRGRSLGREKAGAMPGRAKSSRPATPSSAAGASSLSAAREWGGGAAAFPLVVLVGEGKKWRLALVLGKAIPHH